VEIRISFSSTRLEDAGMEGGRDLDVGEDSGEGIGFGSDEQSKFGSPYSRNKGRDTSRKRKSA
jgi:hypothetical protein